jgi:hypothetical protein
VKQPTTRPKTEKLRKTSEKTTWNCLIVDGHSMTWSFVVLHISMNLSDDEHTDVLLMFDKWYQYHHCSLLSIVDTLRAYPLPIDDRHVHLLDAQNRPNHFCYELQEYQYEEDENVLPIGSTHMGIHCARGRTTEETISVHVAILVHSPMMMFDDPSR